MTMHFCFTWRWLRHIDIWKFKMATLTWMAAKRLLTQGFQLKDLVLLWLKYSPHSYLGFFTMWHTGSKKVHSKKAHVEALDLLRFILGCDTVSLELHSIPNRSQRQDSKGGKRDSTFWWRHNRSHCRRVCEMGDRVEAIFENTIYCTYTHESMQ